MPDVRVCGFSGSLRRESLNTRLLRLAVDAVRAAGAEVDLLDLREFAMPVYDGDLEAGEGVPEPAMRLKRIFAESDGFLIASPEYNSSMSAAMKNTIDWVSRPVPGEAPLGAFKGKVAGLLAASPGYYGGYRGLTQLRWVLQNIGVIVLPSMVAVPGADKAFTPAGTLEEPRHRTAIEGLAKSLVETAAALGGER